MTLSSKDKKYINLQTNEKKKSFSKKNRRLIRKFFFFPQQAFLKKIKIKEHCISVRNLPNTDIYKGLMSISFHGRRQKQQMETHTRTYRHPRTRWCPLISASGTLTPPTRSSTHTDSEVDLDDSIFLDSIECGILYPQISKQEPETFRQGKDMDVIKVPDKSMGNRVPSFEK